MQDAEDPEMTIERALAVVLLYSKSVDNGTLNDKEMAVFSRAKKRVRETAEEVTFEEVCR
jgi:hypothetical protein